MYPSNCDDIDISNGVIATHRYDTIVTMLSYNSEHRPRWSLAAA